MSRERKTGRSRRAFVLGCGIIGILFVLGWGCLSVVNMSQNDHCFTQEWRKDVKAMGHPRREFRDPPDSPLSCHLGTTGPAKGAPEGRGTPLLFDDVLVGQGRVLEVRIPEDPTADFGFAESKAALEGPRNAVLIYEHTCCATQEQFQATFNQVEGNVSDPYEIVSTHFGLKLPEGLDEVNLLTLTFSNIFDWHGRAVHWTRDPAAGTWTVTRTVTDAGRSYDVVDMGWGVRSRAEISRARWGVVPAVALDLVTGPFQIAFLLALGVGYH